MQDRLIFPSQIEQVGTKELIHTAFPLVVWTDVEETEHHMSDILLEIAPVVFFEWAYVTPGGQGPILLYCLNLSIQYLLEPTEWMNEIVMRLKYAPKRLTDGA